MAQATPGGRGGIAVVRLSGEGAKAVGKMICGSLPEAWSLKPCSFSRCGGEVIDSGLVIFLLAPGLIPEKTLWNFIVMAIH